MNSRFIYIIQILLIIFITSSSVLISRDYGNGSHTIKIVIPEVALLDIESEISKNMILNITPPIEAGNPIQGNIDNSLWLNVTSIASSGNARNISVKIDETIHGIDLNVISNPYSGSGFGSWGTPNSELTLTTNDQTLVGGITSGVSGQGPFNGYNLKYSAKSNNSNYGEITSSSADEVTVTYTLTQ